MEGSPILWSQVGLGWEGFERIAIPRWYRIITLLFKTRIANVLFCVYELIRDSLTFRATRPWVWDLKVWAINIKFPLWSPRWRVVRAALFYGALIISPRVSNGAGIWLLGLTAISVTRSGHLVRSLLIRTTFLWRSSIAEQPLEHWLGSVNFSGQ